MALTRNDFLYSSRPSEAPAKRRLRITTSPKYCLRRPDGCESHRSFWSPYKDARALPTAPYCGAFS